MKQIPLYMDSKKNFFYVTEETIACNSCSRRINDILFLRVDWGRSSQINFLCQKCLGQPVFEAQVSEYRIVKLINKRKLDFVPVLIFFNGLKNSERDLSVFDAEKINSSHTQDKTILAGRESFMGSVVGNVEALNFCQTQDKVLSITDGISLLKNIQEAELVLPYDDKKLLEERNEIIN